MKRTSIMVILLAVITLMFSGISCKKSETDDNSSLLLLATAGGGLLGPNFSNLSKYTQDIFVQSRTDNTTTAILGNGYVLVAYSDVAAPGYTYYGKYVIYDEEGMYKTGYFGTFYSGYTTYKKAMHLQNGSTMLIYGTGSNGTRYSLFSTSGSITSSGQIMATGSSYISAVLLNNGNVMVSYCGSGGIGQYLILNSSGTIQSGPFTFTTNTVTSTSAVTLSNGNVMIVYADSSDGYKGKSIVVTQSGAVVQTAKEVMDVGTGRWSTVLLNNGNVLAFNRNQCVVINENGSAVSSKIDYNGMNTGDILEAVLLQSGYVLVAFDNRTIDRGYTIIVKPDGNPYGSAYCFETDETGFISAARLANGMVFVSYCDLYDEFGKRVIMY